MIDVKDESGEENKKEESSETLKLIQALKEELEELKQQKTQVSDPGNTAQLMKELVEGLKQKSDSEKYGGDGVYVDNQDIDYDDILPEENWVRFFAYTVGYVIVDDKRNGRPVRTPFGNEIKFKYQLTKKTQSGKDYNIVNIASYVCRSKKELEWLKSHTLYNLMFFTKINSSATPDNKKAAKLVKFMNHLNTQGQQQLVATSRQHGLEAFDDLSEMRLAIANKLADDELKKELNANTVRLEDRQKEQDLLESKA